MTNKDGTNQYTPLEFGQECDDDIIQLRILDVQRSWDDKTRRSRVDYHSAKERHEIPHPLRGMKPSDMRELLAEADLCDSEYWNQTPEF